jgi:hypothetical protein
MPYMHVGNTVYKKNADGSRGAKVGTTKGSVKKYLAALHIHTDKGKSHVAKAIEAKG